jgi:hypothetical protein
MIGITWREYAQLAAALMWASLVIDPEDGDRPRTAAEATKQINQALAVLEAAFSRGPSNG